jgi:hypothetical protein
MPLPVIHTPISLATLPVMPHTPVSLGALVGAAAGRLPRPAANLAAAHWALETAGGASCYAFNIGNLTCGAAPSAPCGLNPLVTSPGLQFAMFDGLFGGADAYLTFIKAHGGYDQLLAANLQGFAQALASMGYAGAGMPASTYAAQLSGWLPKTQAAVIPPTPSGIGVGTVATVVAVGVVGVFFGTWAAEGFKRPKIPSFPTWSWR